MPRGIHVISIAALDLVGVRSGPSGRTNDPGSHGWLEVGCPLGITRTAPPLGKSTPYDSSVSERSWGWTTWEWGDRSPSVALW